MAADSLRMTDPGGYPQGYAVVGASFGVGLLTGLIANERLRAAFGIMLIAFSIFFLVRQLG